MPLSLDGSILNDEIVVAETAVLDDIDGSGPHSVSSIFSLSSSFPRISLVQGGNTFGIFSAG